MGRPTLHISGPVNDTRQEVKSLRQGVMGSPEEVADIVGLTTKRPIEYLIRDQAARKLECKRGVPYMAKYLWGRLSSFTLQNMGAGPNTLSWCEQYVIICHLWP